MNFKEWFEFHQPVFLSVGYRVVFDGINEYAPNMGHILFSATDTRSWKEVHAIMTPAEFEQSHNKAALIISIIYQLLQREV